MIVEYIRYKLATDALDDVAAKLEDAYAKAASSLDASAHCLGYELCRCVEERERYILRIEWDSMDGHLQGFRRGPEFAPFLEAIRPYISQIEEMQHYETTSVVARKSG
jgi:quinol monooxygenase YgiN